MQFEWDEAKNLENIRKHRIDFVDVPEMFDNPMLIELDERFDYGEERCDWHRFFTKRCGGCRLDRTTRQCNSHYLSTKGFPDMSVNNSNNTSRTDWAALEAMADEDIDYSDIPPLTDEFFENATLRVPAAQAYNIVQLDSEVMAWFREQGADYKTLINLVLRRYIESRGDRQVG